MGTNPRAASFPLAPKRSGFYTRIVLCFRSALMMLFFTALLPCPVAVAAESLELPGIENAFRVTARILSGSEPKGDEAFAALAKLGVKTIVSVDGARPDLAAARRHGVRYVHLPFGYDSVPAARIPEFASVASEADGSIFVHCHHGKHRGPAAVAIMCTSSEGWSPAKATEWLRKAGTGEEYTGLYRSVMEFKPPTKEQLAGVGPLPEAAKTPDIVDAMIELEERFEALEAAQRSGWPALAANDATLLREHLRELARLDDTAKRSDSYRTVLAAGIEAAAALEGALRPVSAEKADVAFRHVGENCTSCHKEYRNQRK